MPMSAFQGLLVGALAFLLIGLFHPIVIKTEYHLGTKVWWAFLLLGLVAGTVSVFCSQFVVSATLGVLAFTSFWTIKELFEQEERVNKGWFPANPKRKPKNTPD